MKEILSINIRKKFMDELAVRTAPVLFDLKPSVLIALHNDYREWHGFNWFTAFKKYRYFIEKSLCISSYILKETMSSMQVLFYRNTSMEKRLNDPLCKKFLRKMGYDCSTCIGYLEELKQRYKVHDFPHEIGVFLGYPLKDVVGFMYNKERSSYNGKTYWKIYGKVQPSISLMNKHKKARIAVRKMVRDNRLNVFQKKMMLKQQRTFFE